LKSKLKNEWTSADGITLFLPDFKVETVDILLSLLYSGKSETAGDIDPVSGELYISQLYQCLRLDGENGGLPDISELDSIPTEFVPKQKTIEIQMEKFKSPKKLVTLVKHEDSPYPEPDSSVDGIQQIFPRERSPETISSEEPPILESNLDPVVGDTTSSSTEEIEEVIIVETTIDDTIHVNEGNDLDVEFINQTIINSSS